MSYNINPSISATRTCLCTCVYACIVCIHLHVYIYMYIVYMAYAIKNYFTGVPFIKLGYILSKLLRIIR